MLRVETLSVFPEMFDTVMSTSILGRAREMGALEFVAHDLRQWTHDRHRTTDDEPYGGGPGQLMKVEPVFEALDALLAEESATGEPGREPEEGLGGEPGLEPDWTPDGERGGNPERNPNGERGGNPERNPNGERGGNPEQPPAASQKVIFFTPHGQPFNQALAAELAKQQRLIMVCGRYEGFDERVYSRADFCISLGDYILTGGELAAMVVSDAVCRLLPGVLGSAQSNLDESFSQGLLEYPQYTRPANYRGLAVPEVLLSGNHAAIAQWRRKMSIIKTAELRPDLLAEPGVDAAEVCQVLNELKTSKEIGAKREQ